MCQRSCLKFCLNLSLRTRTMQVQTQHPHMALTPWFEPGPHLWEASALTTARSLYLDLQIIIIFLQYFYLNSFIVLVCLCVRLKKLVQNAPVIICCNWPLGRLLKCIQFHKPKPTLLLVFAPSNPRPNTGHFRRNHLKCEHNLQIHLYNATKM